MKNFLPYNSELTEKTEVKKWQSGRGELREPECSKGVAEPHPPDRRNGPSSEKNAPSDENFRGWILYDGNCRYCIASAETFARFFGRRGFQFIPLQTPWVMKRLGLNPNAPLEEMHVLTVDGRDIAGADAVVFLARQIWWAWPMVGLARVPGIHALLDRGYRWVAAHRGCDHIACDLKERRLPSRRFKEMAGPSRTGVWRQPLLEVFPAWIALIALPISVLPLRDRIAPWQFMWLMAAAIFFGCKWLTAWRAQPHNSELKASRAFAYFFAWPGMDADKFLLPNPARRQLDGLKPSSLSLAKKYGWPGLSAERLLSAHPTHRQLDGLKPSSLSLRHSWPAIGRISVGAFLLFGLARFAPRPLLAGWIGMVGMILILHFGLFHLLAAAWRKTGIDVEPIMDAPLRSKSLSEFWGCRWNSAFNQLAFEFVFRPIACLHLRQGAQVALLAAFLFSGAIHELVISLPAGAGYGLPTLYFILQGTGILVERALPEIRGRIFTILTTAVPAFWLFHPPFVDNVILPFMKASGAL